MNSSGSNGPSHKGKGGEVPLRTLTCTWLNYSSTPCTQDSSLTPTIMPNMGVKYF